MSSLDIDALRLYTVLADGGLALARTDTGYGLVAMKAEAVRRIYRLKGRSRQKPCVTVGSMPVLDDLTTDVDLSTRAWIAEATRQWPLAVVAATNPHSRLLRGYEPYVRDQCTKGSTVALFFGVGALISRAAEIAREHGRLLVGSSANHAGTGNNYTLDDVPAAIRREVDIAFDDGASPYRSVSGSASTILDLTSGTFQRRGAAFDRIAAAWESHRGTRAHGYAHAA